MTVLGWLGVIVAAVCFVTVLVILPSKMGGKSIDATPEISGTDPDP